MTARESVLLGRPLHNGLLTGMLRTHVLWGQRGRQMPPMPSMNSPSSRRPEKAVAAKKPAVRRPEGPARSIGICCLLPDQCPGTLRGAPRNLLSAVTTKSFHFGTFSQSRALASVPLMVISKSRTVWW